MTNELTPHVPATPHQTAERVVCAAQMLTALYGLGAVIAAFIVGTKHVDHDGHEYPWVWLGVSIGFAGVATAVVVYAGLAYMYWRLSEQA